MSSKSDTKLAITKIEKNLNVQRIAANKLERGNKDENHKVASEAMTKKQVALEKKKSDLSG
jgi:hypothetical protein